MVTIIQEYDNVLLAIITKTSNSLRNGFFFSGLIADAQNGEFVGIG
jgi:hypothetical protein